MYEVTTNIPGFQITVTPNSGQGANLDPTFNVTAANSLRAKVGCALTSKCVKDITVTVKAKNSINAAVEMSLAYVLKTVDELAYLKASSIPD